jgi:hypothetical protein
MKSNTLHRNKTGKEAKDTAHDGNSPDKQTLHYILTLQGHLMSASEITFVPNTNIPVVVQFSTAVALQTSIRLSAAT